MRDDRSHRGSSHRTVRAGVCVLLCAAFSGCGLSWESNFDARPATVDSVAVPDSVALGTTFPVDIATSGTTSLWRQGYDTVSRPDSLHVIIFPYDYEYTAIGISVGGVRRFHHVVPVQATARGLMEIDVKVVYRADGQDRPIVVNRAVRVF